MDKLDIFEMPMGAKIITTIEELQRLYHRACEDGREIQAAESAQDKKWIEEVDNRQILIHGDIV